MDHFRIERKQKFPKLSSKIRKQLAVGQGLPIENRANEDNGQPLTNSDKLNRHRHPPKGMFS